MVMEGWITKKLYEICNIESGKAHEPFIHQYGEYICVTSKFISSEGTSYRKCYENLKPAKENDILMVLSDLPNGRALAKCLIVDQKNDGRFAVNQRIGHLKPTRIHPKLLYYLLNRNKYFLEFDDGVNQTNLSNKSIENCPLTFPSSLIEQQAIADSLSDADALITSQEKLIKKKQLLLSGMTYYLLKGCKNHNGEVVEKRKYKLEDILSVMHGKDQKAVRNSNGDFPIFGSGGFMGWSSTAIYNESSVLIGRKGTIDKPIFVEEPFWTIDTMFYTVISKNFNPRYIYYIFQLVDWKKYNEASGVPSLNAKTIESIEVELPERKIQDEFSSYLFSLSQDIEEAKSKLDKLKKIKTGMTQELLTGRTRLI